MRIILEDMIVNGKKVKRLECNFPEWMTNIDEIDFEKWKKFEIKETIDKLNEEEL